MKGRVVEMSAISHGLLHLVMCYTEMEKKTRYYETDVPIYNSEIHLIGAIAQNPEIHIRGLAEKFGITSASVSEMISKMQKKGLVEKHVDKENHSRIQITLTDKGKLADRVHRRYHEELDQMVRDELRDASEEKIAFLNAFLENMTRRMEEFPF